MIVQVCYHYDGGDNAVLTEEPSKRSGNHRASLAFKRPHYRWLYNRPSTIELPPLRDEIWEQDGKKVNAKTGIGSRCYGFYLRS
jgi:hypothetical protein